MTDPSDPAPTPTRIAENVVVEGRADERAVKAAVDAEVIVTSGYGLSKETWTRIETAQARTGVILFTDPDPAGDQIRRRINRRVPGCKNAYLTRGDARRKENIGIENARPAAIRKALRQARCTAAPEGPCFTLADLQHHRLMAHPQAARRREALGRLLAIGYANAKQLLARLNRCGISRAQFEAALAEVENSGPTKMRR
ncbi:MAG: ribonuclease M5 [Desulfosarcinaceae bacterium]|jgi:ribonuclease M5